MDRLHIDKKEKRSQPANCTGNRSIIKELPDEDSREDRSREVTFTHLGVHAIRR